MGKKVYEVDKNWLEDRAIILLFFILCSLGVWEVLRVLVVVDWGLLNRLGCISVCFKIIFLHLPKTKTKKNPSYLRNFDFIKPEN